ncbi:hypothetical protein IQ241_12000 [Romeria aff. gracilis LEGE 07310]|uniref:Uncharacterized protein n=1 Tax=Vasconcelosia minhoensis LEGE 07310 TaxID=915328 RepID=A0A8J7DLZ3_9CYAN|nr:hypothetical protein [Romeria gracilis]MBE9078006.1 hypothetical protein [Romeria aff. gracilis LEGE 07310]
MESYSHPSNCQIELQRRQLEQLWQTPSAAPAQPWQVLRRLGAWLVKALTTSNELRIWVSKSSSGVLWHAYDPVTRQSRQFTSEHELRSWIDQRYYQHYTQ